MAGVSGNTQNGAKSKENVKTLRQNGKLVVRACHPYALLAVNNNDYRNSTTTYLWRRGTPPSQR